MDVDHVMTLTVMITMYVYNIQWWRWCWWCW